MKKNCNGCRALESALSGLGCRCALGHPIECINEVWGVPVTYKPMEECEKPTTFKKLCEVSQGRKGNSRN